MPEDKKQTTTPRFQERTCTACGKAWIGQGSCPFCGGIAKSGDEFTKKVVEPPDLLK